MSLPQRAHEALPLATTLPYPSNVGKNQLYCSLISFRAASMSQNRNCAKQYIPCTVWFVLKVGYTEAQTAAGVYNQSHV